MEKPSEPGVAEILATDPEIQLTKYPDDKQSILSIWLPKNCNIYGSIHADGHVHISNFEVPSELQGNGIGERLLRIFSEKAKENGATVLTGWIKSISALKTRKKVFGKDNLKIYTKDNKHHPIKIEEALSILGQEKSLVYCETVL